MNPNYIGLRKCRIGYWVVYAPDGWAAYPAVTGRRFWIPTKHLAWNDGQPHQRGTPPTSGRRYFGWRPGSVPRWAQRVWPQRVQ